MIAIDMAGQRYGHAVVVTPAPHRGRKTAWTCLCDCGRTFDASSTNLRQGITTSCGCQYVNERHGHFGTPTYKSWAGAISRCHNRTTKNFADYGARGIVVCDRWRISFSAFFADMGERPSKAHTLDRIDNNGNYEPTNCRWATRLEQNRNTRVACRWHIRGHVFDARSDAARFFGVSDALINYWCNARADCRKELAYPC